MAIVTNIRPSGHLTGQAPEVSAMSIAAILGTESTLLGAGSLVAIANLGALLTRSVRRLPAKPQPE